MEKVFKNAIENQINWLESIKDIVAGEAHTLVLFQIDYLKKLLSNTN